MSRKHPSAFEDRVRRLAAEFRYPATPRLAGSKPKARARTLRPALALLAVLLLTLVAVPGVRAAILEFLQIGAVRIFAPEPNPSLEASPPPPTATLFGFEPQKTIYAPENLSGFTTLEQARKAVAFDIGLPAYPPDLGAPDRVYVQEVSAGRHFVILVWGTEGGVEMALYIIGPGVSLTKGPPETIQELEINGRPAAYVRGEHLLIVEGAHEFGGLVESAALIWEGEGDLTYRLEADRPLEELMRIAESIPQ